MNAKNATICQTPVLRFERRKKKGLPKSPQKGRITRLLNKLKLYGNYINKKAEIALIEG